MGILSGILSTFRKVEEVSNTVASTQSSTIIGIIDGRPVVSPRGKVLAVFYPKQTFESDELATKYMAGLRYYVREGNEKLASAAKAWAEAGIVDLDYIKQPEGEK